MICLSAMHAGILTDDVAHELVLTLEDKKKAYPCSNGSTECSVNGIVSKTKDSWPKGFKFEDLNSKAKFFDDKYKGIPVNFIWEEFPTERKKGGFEYKPLPDESD